MPPTLSKAVEGFLLRKGAEGRSPNTLRIYQTDLDKFIAWSKDPYIDRVTSEHIERFFVYLKTEYTWKNPTTGIEKSLSTKTIFNIWTALSSFWNWATPYFKLPDSPMQVPAPSKATKPVHPLTEDEVKRLLVVVKQKVEVKVPGKDPYKAKRPTAVRDKALILTFLDTGARASELANLNMKNLHLREGWMEVTGKGSKIRTVYIGKISQAALWKYLMEKYPDREGNDNDPVFSDQYNLYPMNRNSIRNLVERLGERAGIPNIHPHRFRHTFAINYLRNGGDVYSLQKLLGHTSMDMVKKYLEFAKADLQHAHRRSSPVDNWRIK
jgi:integrase/recombinase XerD